MRKIIVLGLGLALVAAACNRTPESTNNNTNKNNQLTSPANDNRTFVVQLKAQNNSKQNGTARLKAEGTDKVKVNIEVSGSTKDVQQPSHIHMGSCAQLGGVKYTLNNVVNGKSETIVDTTLDQLIKSLPLAINIHKSATEAGVYTACGDVPAVPEGVTTPSPTPSSTTETEKTQITMNSKNFAPATLTVKKGTKVTFKNSDSKAHWPASAPHPSHTDYPGFDPGQAINVGASWSFTFDKVGTWKYHDHLNPTMYGTIVVTE